MKDDHSQKKSLEILYFLQMLQKDGLFKKIALEFIFLYFFSGKYDIFFGRKMKDDLWKVSCRIDGN